MKKKLLKATMFVFPLMFVFLLMFTLTSEAENQSVLVLSTKDFPPFNYPRNGKVVGIDIDTIHEIGKRINVKIRMKYVPWKRLLLMLEHGDADAGFALFYTEKRAKYALYAFAEPMHYSTYNLFVRKGYEFEFNGLKDLYDKKVGIARAFSISNEFDKAVKDGKIKIEEVNTSEQNLGKLMLNRVDVIVGNEIVTMYNANILNIRDQLSKLPMPIKKRGKAYLALSKASKNIKNKAELLEKINHAFKAVNADGTYQKIVDKYIK
ncbi:MAG: amino acid ABC transporter substrate-binding protein [Desulfobacterales bacterium]|nr:amino acid ABC transporter substrate-binding protein [Desulfobacterales bacterium]